MSWSIEIPIIVRSLINDLSDTPEYSDERIQQLIVVSAQYITKEINLVNEYSIDIVNPNIIPDPTLGESRDLDFISFVSLKASCLLDQSTLRTRAATEGIRAALGPASISVGGNIRGFETILKNGPCALYSELKMQHELGNTSLIRAVLSPFVGNNFDPSYAFNPSPHTRNFFS